MTKAIALVTIAVVAISLSGPAAADDRKVETGPSPAAGPPVITGSGGPDQYGHTWKDSDEPDGPVYDWVEINTIGTPVVFGDDDNQGPFPIGFTFRFYGKDYTEFRACSNGFLQFVGTNADFTNQPLPYDFLDTDELIAPFWDDLNPTQGGTCYYWSNDVDTCIFEWDDVPRFYNEGACKFQVILLADGRIIFQYDLGNCLTFNACTVGIQNQDFSDCLQIAFNQTYLHPSMAIEIIPPALVFNCLNLTPIVIPGSYFSFSLDFDNNSGSDVNVTADLTTYFDPNCNPDNIDDVMPHDLTIPPWQSLQSYYIWIPWNTPPGQYSVGVSFDYGGQTYSCCMNAQVVEGRRW